MAGSWVKAKLLYPVRAGCFTGLPAASKPVIGMKVFGSSSTPLRAIRSLPMLGASRRSGMPSPVIGEPEEKKVRSSVPAGTSFGFTTKP